MPSPIGVAFEAAHSSLTLRESILPSQLMARCQSSAQSRGRYPKMMVCKSGLEFRSGALYQGTYVHRATLT